MARLDLSAYGIPQVLELSVDFLEFPATTSNPKEAPIIFLVDEDHLAQPVIDVNAVNVARIVEVLPETVVVLEHFSAGEVVSRDSVSRHIASNFHAQLAQRVLVSMYGGDDDEAHEAIDEVDTENQGRLVYFPLDNRHLSPAELAEGEQKVREEGQLAIRNHPRQPARSKRLIETLLALLGDNKRIGVINAGGNHNTHLLTNPEYEGEPVCRARSDVSFIRLRAVNERRQLAAYYNWIRRGRPLWEDLVDWDWAKQTVPRLMP